MSSSEGSDGHEDSSSPPAALSAGGDLFRKYFCIFCDSKFEQIDSAFNHYKEHMNSPFYCKICDFKLSTESSDAGENDAVEAKNGTCDVDHESLEAETDISSESSIIDMWIERFLSYQEEIQNKAKPSVVSSTKFFLGCPACDILIKECHVEVPNDVLQHREVNAAKESEKSDSSGTVQCTSDLLFGGGKDSVKCHTVRHVCAHLRYYPYECTVCEENGKYQKKPDISEMMRHVKDAHGTNMTSANTDLLVKFVRITKLERFIEWYLRTHPMVRFDPVGSTPSKQLLNHSDMQRVVNPDLLPPNSGRITYPKGMVTMSQPPKLISSLLMKKSTSLMTKNRVNSSAPNSLLDSRQNRPVAKPGRPTVAQTNRDNFHLQFQNIFDGDMMKMSMNQEEDLNVDYFCIFCQDFTTKDKDEARRHYQSHVDYHPIICSLCGVGSTDLPEFLKHHTSKHPEAEKGRYKRKEQPHVEKWINGFLYAQATIIRAFPPREQCPVCDRVFTPDQVAAARPRRCTVNRRIDHVHRHLCYLPYECIRCRDEGREFLVAYFESKAHSHIKLKHPDVDDQESRWFLFQKTIGIPKLDDYISTYLEQFGINMNFERRPVKKQARETPFSSPDSVPNSAPNSMVSSHPTLSAALAAEDSGGSGDTPFFQPEDDESSNSGPHPQSLLARITPKTMKNEDVEEMVVPVSPSIVDPEGFDVSELTGIPSNTYFCIFCPKTFGSKISAFIHLGLHLEYFPIICLICSNKFLEMNRFAAHHKKDHPTSADLKFEVREDFVLEKWVDDMLHSERTGVCKSLLLNCSCAAFCPVCEKLLSTTGNGVPSSSSVCRIHQNPLDFSEHVHQHLDYYAYECSLCKTHEKITTRVMNLDMLALSHVKETHGLETASVLQLCKLFRKSNCVLKLEEMISQCIQRKISFGQKTRDQLQAALENQRQSIQQMSQRRTPSLLSQNPNPQLNRMLSNGTKHHQQHYINSNRNNQPVINNRPAQMHHQMKSPSPITQQKHQQRFHGAQQNQPMRVVSQGNLTYLQVVSNRNKQKSPFSNSIPQPSKVS